MKKHTNQNPDSTHLRRKAEDQLKLKIAETLDIYIVPTGLYYNLYFAFYQYIVPTGQSCRD